MYVKWSEAEIDYLLNNYLSATKEEIEKNIPNRNWNAITQTARKRFGLSKRNKRWSKAEEEFLVQNYYNLDQESLLEYFSITNRSWDAIKLHARVLNLNRSADIYRESKLSILLDNSLISNYWIGFILADGHISDNIRLHINLSKVDENHLKKFADYIKCYNVYNFSINTGYKLDAEYCKLSAQNKEIIPKLCEIYQIQSNKTENPPEFKKYTLSNEQLLSLIIGFIDGDGNIQKLQNRKYCNLRIKNHISWINNLKFIENKVYEIFPTAKNSDSLTKENNEGYASLIISNYQIIKQIKQFALDNQLPILERKWDKVIL